MTLFWGISGTYMKHQSAFLHKFLIHLPWGKSLIGSAVCFLIFAQSRQVFYLVNPPNVGKRGDWCDRRLKMTQINQVSRNRLYNTAEGQTKQKYFFQADVSSKKRTKEFDYTTMKVVFVGFFEEIEDTKKKSKLTDLLKLSTFELWLQLAWLGAKCKSKTLLFSH